MSRSLKLYLNSNYLQVKNLIRCSPGVNVPHQGETMPNTLALKTPMDNYNTLISIRMSLHLCS